MYLYYTDMGGISLMDTNRSLLPRASGHQPLSSAEAVIYYRRFDTTWRSRLIFYHKKICFPVCNRCICRSTFLWRCVQSVDDLNAPEGNFRESIYTGAYLKWASLMGRADKAKQWAWSTHVIGAVQLPRKCLKVGNQNRNSVLKEQKKTRVISSLFMY